MSIAQKLGAMTHIDLKGLTPKQIEHFCVAELGQKPGRGLAVAARLFRDRMEDLSALPGINRGLLSGIASRCEVSTISVERTEASKDGTLKLLYRLRDGNTVEGVLIPGPNNRLTLCISTQVGCASGCRFCLTGSSGFIRNLTAAEMVNQVFAAHRLAGAAAVTNLVLMGTGEPFANYDAVRTFVEIAVDRNGMGYSSRKVIVSTSGIAPMIERMAEEIEASLAVSLNAVSDDIRSGLMPINDRYPISRLLQSIRCYTEKTGRSVTIEYVLIKGVNDSVEDAKRLAELFSEIPCMINILLFNPFPGSSFERPGDGRASVFRDVLVSRDMVAVVRKSRGWDIQAACGQLRASGTALIR